MPKPLSEQLADLSARAKSAEDAAATAKKETHDKIVARREQVHSAAAAATADAHAGAVVAMRDGPHDRGGGPVHDRRAARPRASGPVNAFRAHDSVGLRNFNREQAQNQQAQCNLFHRSLLECDIERFRDIAALDFPSDLSAAGNDNGGSAYFSPACALAIASLQPSLMSATCDFMQSAILPPLGFTSAQNCLTSALQALATVPALMIAT